MKTIRIAYLGFWSDFDPEDNMFSSILKKRYHVVLDQSDPEFLICSPLCLPFEYMKYNCPRIMFSGENISPDFTAIDYFIGFDDISFGDRALRFPLFLYQNPIAPNDRPGLTEDAAWEILKSKEYFCNYIYGHDTEQGIREQILETLQSYKRVECAGRHRNNMPDGMTIDYHSKVPFMRKCKFSICVESLTYPGFTTEKILHGFQSNSIPIYFGDPDIGKCFHSTAFLNVHDFESMDALLERVIEIDQNDDLYVQMLCERPYIEEHYEALMFEKLEQFLYHIFDQDWQDAYRRPRFYNAFWHEQYLRNYYRSTIPTKEKILRKLGLVSRF